MLAEQADLVQLQFEKEAKLGVMVQTTLRAAMTAYGDDLTIAATTAIEKKGRNDEVGVIFDATHGVNPNPGIRVRGQVCYSTAADTQIAVGGNGRRGRAALLDLVRHAHGPPPGSGPGGLGLAGLPDQRLRHERHKEGPRPDRRGRQEAVRDHGVEGGG